MSIVQHDNPETSTALAIDPSQRDFTNEQRAALEQIGVEKASDGDLAVFFHVCKRSGLDPFARQIYMIGRYERVQIDGQWTRVLKQTIQTGIDGYRLIGRRAASKAGHKLSVSAPLWRHPDSGWQDVWSGQWGYPIAAKVRITRDGEPFVGVAMFDEYKQTNRDGHLTAMWAQRPAGMLAKCAEALAWRMAFPQDLAGIYTDDEMAHADSAEPVTSAPQRTGLAAVLGETTDASSGEPRPPVKTPEEVPADARTVQADDELLDTRGGLAKAMYAAFDEAGITDRDQRLKVCTEQAGREITSSEKLTAGETRRIIRYLEQLPVAAEIVDDAVQAEEASAS